MKLSKKLGLIIIGITFVNVAFAAAGGGYGEIHWTDIIHPWINFAIIFGFIGWKIKGMISDAFTKNAEEVESLYIVAEEKDKEAQIKLDALRKKFDQVESAKEKIIQNAMTDAEKFEAKYREEIESNIERLKREAANKVESEKNEMMRELNASLLEQVISKTKTSVKSNDEYRKKAAEKLLSEVR